MEGEDARVMNLKGQRDAGGDAQQSKIVISEMEEFVLGLQLNEGTRKPEGEDVFMDDDEDAASSGTLAKDGTSRLAVIKEEADIEDTLKDGEQEDVRPDEAVHEAAVGKGFSWCSEVSSGARDSQRRHRFGRQNHGQEQMRAAQARSKTPYLVLSGNSKSSPRGYTRASLPWSACKSDAHARQQEDWR